MNQAILEHIGDDIIAEIHEHTRRYPFTGEKPNPYNPGVSAMASDVLRATRYSCRTVVDRLRRSVDVKSREITTLKNRLFAKSRAAYRESVASGDHPTACYQASVEELMSADFEVPSTPSHLLYTERKLDDVAHHFDSTYYGGKCNPEYLPLIPPEYRHLYVESSDIKGSDI